MGRVVIPWLAVALAQQPTPPEPAGSDVYEIVVWGDLAVDQARDAIVRDMESLGWRVRRTEGDEVVFAPPRAWMGRAVLHADGTFTFGRPVVGFAPMPPEVWLEQQGTPPELRAPQPTVGAGPTFWVLPSERRLAPVREAVLRATREEVDAYQRILRRTAFEEGLQELPARLDALWRDGTPLEPGAPPLATPDERRRAVLAYWASRADTWEGGRVASAIEVWLAETVQTSEHPITDAERAEFRRNDGHVLPP